MRFIPLCFLAFVCSSTLCASDIYTLHPHPKEAYLKPGKSPCMISSATPIFLSPNSDARCLQAIHLFNANLRATFGDTLVVTNAKLSGVSIRLYQLNGQGNANALFFQLPNTFMPDTEGYVIDVDSTGVLIFFPIPPGRSMPFQRYCN